MSTIERQRDRPSEVVAGFLAAASIFVSAIGIAYRPARLTLFAAGLAFVAVVMGGGGRHGRLAAFAVAAAGVAFLAGMIIAVITKNPLY